VRPPAKTAIDEHRNFPRRSRHDFRQALDRSAIAFFGAPTVIRYNNAVNTMLDRELGVFTRDDPLQYQLHRSYIFQAFDDVPGHVQRVLSDDLGEIETLKHWPAA